jgi:hypothetical protein
MNKDIGVVIFFFNRPEPLEHVFQSVREAKVKKLFLIQDGARLNNHYDVENIKLCRDIISVIDWECEVHYNFSDINLSCDHRIFTGITWAFEHVDKLIILEDDCLAAQSFFPFCEEILNKYEFDNRVLMISGMNYFDEHITDGSSYFFSNTASGWGWATWKRSWLTAVEQADFEFLNDSYLRKTVKDNLENLNYQEPAMINFIPFVEKIRQENLKTKRVNSWEYAIGIAKILNSSLIITPTKNLISNIGLTNDSTHAVNQINKLDKITQNLFFKKTFKINFPLIHPKYVIRNFEYEKKHSKQFKTTKLRCIESVIRRVYYSSNKERKLLFEKFVNKMK